MKTSKLWLYATVWMIPLLFLASCAGVESTGQVATPTAGQTIAPPVDISTRSAAATTTVTLTPGHPAALEPTITAQLTGNPTMKSEYQASGIAAEPFNDCARTPGLAGCAGEPLPLTGRLAVYDSSVPRVIALDLASGAGWQVPFHAEALEWAPTGSMLLLRHDTEGGPQYQVWSAAGERLEAPSDNPLQRWQWPAKLVGQDTLEIPADGSEFRLELATGPRWVLHARLGYGEERELVIDPQPADKQYLLLDRAVGDGRLLAQAYYPTNLGLSTGGELLLIDPSDGKQQGLEIRAPLGQAASLSWNPTQPTLAALLASGAEPGMTTLALVDFSTLEKRSPLPEGVQVSSLSWSPDGRQLAFTAEPLPGILSSAAQETYAKAGIYLLDPQSDAVRNLLSFPDSAAGGWVRWTTDGKSLIYALALLDPTGKTSIEVHAYEPAGSLACVLIQGLPLSGGARERMDWQQMIAYGPNPNE